jgi:hypothetical protein
MLEVLVVLVVSVVVGVAVARWWIVPVPPILVAVWVLIAALGGDTERETDPWVFALFYGGFVGLICITGLSVGVIWGRWLRDRRREAAIRSEARAADV